MNSSKKLTLVTALVVMLTATPLYAKDKTDDSSKMTKITTAETGSLATIAAIDKNEIMLSIVASNKKASSDVSDFAKIMIEMHGSNLTQILEMVNTFHATPFMSRDAEKIKLQGMKEMLDLGALQGKEFDKAYIDAMVKGHEAALAMIDQHLMKTAKSDEIKKFLTDTRAVIVQHLEDAKKLQKNMES